MNFLKDFGVGVLAISAIVLVVQAFMFLPTLFGFSEGVGTYAFYTVLGVYFTWAFGGLTRSVYFKEKN